MIHLTSDQESFVKKEVDDFVKKLGFEQEDSCLYACAYEVTFRPSYDLKLTVYYGQSPPYKKDEIVWLIMFSLDGFSRAFEFQEKENAFSFVQALLNDPDIALLLPDISRNWLGD